MKEIIDGKNWIAGVQWFFFIFANIVVIPITVGEAFGLTKGEVVPLMQMAFIVTGLACLAQVFLGHRRPILEGQSGLWWGIFLTLVTTASAQGLTIQEVGGSLALGVILAGILTMLVGITGLGPWLARFFTPGVMGVFMLLLGLTLIQNFLKGMLGIPFGNQDSGVVIDLPVAGLSILIALFVMVLSIKTPVQIRSYSILIGIVVGWILFVILFGAEKPVTTNIAPISLFPLGNLHWHTGIVLTSMLAGLLNITNTYGALKGTDVMYGRETTKRDYRTSFSYTGLATIAAGMFGLVPYAPFVSSIGFIRQTEVYARMPFIIGSFLFFLMGVIQPVGVFFSTLPLSIGSAVLFIAYLQMFNSSMDFFKLITLNTMNVYRSAIPVFVGAIIMTFPATYFDSIPTFIRPFLSNGLLVGIILALLLENMLNWERLGGGHTREKGT